MNLYQYKILAFTTSIKLYRRNSCIYKLENKKELSKVIGISYNSFKKYFKYCIDNGLIKETNNAWQFKNLNEISKILNLEITKYILFFKWGNYSTYPKVIDIYNKIIEEKLLVNYKQQQFNIKLKNKEISNLKSLQNRKNAHPSIVKSFIKKYGSIEGAKKSICKDFKGEIVSGKTHISNIIGCSISSSLNILKRLEKKNKLKRKVQVKELNLPYSNIGFDLAKKEGLIIPSDRLKTFFLSLGSIIILNSVG